MPSGDPKLHEYFEHDGNAWEVLKFNFDCDQGVISRKYPEHRITLEERKAIDYLCYEWDYGFQD